MDDYDICQYCNGSGEGYVDGSTCSYCGGSGIDVDTEEEGDGLFYYGEEPPEDDR